jgi:hypothetical protein
VHLTEAEGVAYVKHQWAMMEQLRDELRDTPACWRWPAPLTCTFADEDTAEEFLAKWNRECAICGRTGVLVKDHDHRTGMVRGFLCRSCNIKEGFSSAEVFRRYRERNPASIFGVSIRYYSPITGYAEPDTYEPNLDRAPGYALAAYLADGGED